MSIIFYIKLLILSTAGLSRQNYLSSYSIPWSHWYSALYTQGIQVCTESNYSLYQVLLHKSHQKEKYLEDIDNKLKEAWWDFETKS